MVAAAVVVATAEKTDTLRASARTPGVAAPAEGAAAVTSAGRTATWRGSAPTVVTAAVAADDDSAAGRVATSAAKKVTSLASVRLLGIQVRVV